jgi:hypothetical protein
MIEAAGFRLVQMIPIDTRRHRGQEEGSRLSPASFSGARRRCFLGRPLSGRSCRRGARSPRIPRAGRQECQGSTPATARTGHSQYRSPIVPCMEPVITGRNQEGRFAAGSSGNPRGRPTGARGKATQLLDKMAERGGKAVLQAVLTAAKDGDIGAAALILTRIWPPRRGRPIRFDLPDLLQPGGAPAALAAIARLTADGVVSPEEGAEVGKIIEAHMRAVDMTELVHRLEKLEATFAGATVFPGHAGAATGAAMRRNGGAAG